MEYLDWSLTGVHQVKHQGGSSPFSAEYRSFLVAHVTCYIRPILHHER